MSHGTEVWWMHLSDRLGAGVVVALVLAGLVATPSTSTHSLFQPDVVRENP